MKKLYIVVIAVAAFACGFVAGYYGSKNRPVDRIVQTKPRVPVRETKPVTGKLAAKVKELQREIEEKDRQIGTLKTELSVLHDIVNEINLGEQPKEAPAKTEQEASDSGARAAVPEDTKLAKLAREAAADPLNREVAERYLAEAVHGDTEACEEAVQIYKKAVEANPESADAHYNLGIAYLQQLNSMQDITDMESAMKMGRLAASAIEELSKALEIKPDDFDALLSRGTTYYYFPGRMKDAVADFEKIVGMTKDKPPEDKHTAGYLWLSKAYRASGKKEKALETLREGVRLFPQNERLRRELLNAEKE